MPMVIGGKGGGGSIVSGVGSVAGRTGDVVLTKNDVGLANVDNIAPMDLPISTVVQAALDDKQDILTLKTISGQSLVGVGDLSISKASVGLGSVDDTSDINKPVSNATLSALNLKVDKSSIGVANGVAGLSSSGKVPASQLPDIASGRKVTVINTAARLALSSWPDITIAYQTDDGSTWALNANDTPSVAGNWTELGNAASGGVNSFNSRTGNITPQAGDYNASMVGAAASSHSHAQSDITGLSTALSSKIPASEKGVANGVASLDSNTKIPSAQIPDSVKARVTTVANEAARLALPSVSQVSVVRQSDNNTVYFLPADGNPSSSPSWLGAGGSGGVTRFTGLQDAPSSYAGEANKMLVVDASEAFLKFAPVPSGGGGGGSSFTYVDMGSMTLNQVKNTTGAYVIGVMELTAKAGLIPTMTSDTAPSPFVVSASSSYGGYPAWYAFNGANANEWYSAGTAFPHWLRVDMGAVAAVAKYSIRRDDNYVNENPRTWVFQGSSDNTNWVDLDTQTDVTFAGAFEVKEFVLSSTATYRYYRLFITKTAANTATSYACVNQLVLQAAGATQYDSVQRVVDNTTYRVTTTVTGTSFANNTLAITKLSTGTVEKLIAIVAS